MARISKLPRLSLAHKVVAGFAAAFCMVLALAILLDANRQRQLDMSKEIAQTQSLVDELEATLSVIKDGETGTRGYVITGDDEYLEPYYTALSTITGHLKHLDTLVENDPTQTEFLRQLEPKIERRLDISREVVVLRRSKGFEAAQEKILSGEGKVEMDAIRGLVSQMQAGARAQLAAMSEQSETHAAGTAWLLVTVPLFLVFIAMTYVQISRDMRSRQRTEQALVASESRFKAIVENTTDAIFIKDVTGKYTMMNRAGATLFGLSAEAISGMDDIDLFGDEKGRDIIETDRRVLQNGTLTNYESPLPVRGRKFIYNTTKFPYLSPAGELLGLIGISRNVTEARTVEAELRRQKAELSALNETTLGLLNGLGTQSLLEAIVVNASSLLGIPDTFLYVRQPDGQEMTVRAATGIFAGWIGLRLGYGQGMSGRVWESGETMFLDDYSCWEHRRSDLDDLHMRAMMGVPLRAGGKVVGVLGLAHVGDDRSQMTEDEVELLSRFARMASVALQNANLYEIAQQEIKERKRAEEALHELAIRDEVTGLYNRRELMRLLTEEVARCQRHKRPMSLILIDFDHFKKVNDTHGHQAGDAVLAWLSGILNSSVRSIDRPARYGGEEFAVIVPELSARSAWEFAERLRRKVASTPCEVSTHDGETVRLSLTISIGVASYPTDGDSGEELIAAADQALYVAKRKGRNLAIMHADELATRSLPN